MKYAVNMRQVWKFGVMALFVALLGLSAFWLFYQSRAVVTDLISEDIARLAKIFERIDSTAGIISFDYEKNNVNFLNVGTFAGSEVGPMNLRHAQKWEGPYVQDNPTMQQKEYQVIKTYQGYFIVPGEGVRLSNGKVMGKDIVIRKDTDVQALIDQEGLLRDQGKTLGVRLDLNATKSNWLEKEERMLFEQALPDEV